MSIENEELSDDQLFNSAIGDEPEILPEAPVVEEQPEKPAEVVAGSETPVEKPVVDDNAPLVPSWRLREINEEKRTLADRLAALEAEKVTWQTSKPAAEAPKPEKAAKPDPLLDPDAYEAYIEQKVEAKLLNDRREESLQRAAQASPEEFKEAYSAAQKAIDPALMARMQSSRDPGKTLLEWHRENKVKAEVGTDPNAWLEKKLEERLKDPAFLAKAVELARGSAQTQTNGRPNIDMGSAKPMIAPSLSGSSRANASLKSADQDISDHELFEATTG